MGLVRQWVDAWKNIFGTIMNNELLARIEKLENLTARLEQGIQDIWSSCSCLRKELDREEIPPNPEDLCGGEYFNCEPGCWDCGEFLCICEPEEEEPEIDEDQGEKDHD